MGQPQQELFEVVDMGDITIIQLPSGALNNDQENAEMGRQFLALFGAGRKKIIINCCEVFYMSSSFLGVIITLQKALLGAGGKLVICGLADSIYEVFQHTKLHNLFNIAKDESVALASF